MLAAALLLLAVEVPMAKPPEALEEIFPRTSLIVDAEVKELRSTDPDTSPQSPDIPRQVVVLSVKRVVRGKLSAAEEKSRELVAVKPSAPYKLRVGVKGPWLLATDAKTGEHTILGRYGPDSWTFEKIEAKLGELRPAQLAP